MSDPDVFLGIGDDEDFGFDGLDDAVAASPAGAMPHGSFESAMGGRAMTGDGASDVGGGFPAVGDGMLPEDSDLLFDEIGAEPVQASPIAQLAARPIEALPPSTGAPNTGSIKSTLGTLLSLRMNARFRRGAAAAAPAPAAAGGTAAAAAGGRATESGASATAGAASGGNDHDGAEVATTASAAASPVTRNTGGFPNLDSEGGWRQKRVRSKVWSAAETARFFDGLRTFGTNLSLIAKLFPGRARTDVLRKFRLEQRTQPGAIATALDPQNEQPIDVDAFAAQSHEWARQNLLSNAGPMDAEDAQLMRELESSEHIAPAPAAPSAAEEAQTSAQDLQDAVNSFGAAISFGDEDDDDKPFLSRPGYTDDAAAAAGPSGAQGSARTADDAQSKKDKSKKAPKSMSAGKKTPAASSAPAPAEAEGDFLLPDDDDVAFGDFGLSPAQNPAGAPRDAIIDTHGDGLNFGGGLDDNDQLDDDFAL
jgi:hypothetical protein